MFACSLCWGSPVCWGWVFSVRDLVVLGRKRGWRNRDGVGEWKGGGGRGWDKGREKEGRRKRGEN